MSKISYYQINKKTMPVYRDVILPVIYEELSVWQGELLEGYFCIGVKVGRTPVGALIAEHEDDTGDMTIISLYVLPDYRRQGIGSMLLKKMTEIAYALFQPLPEEYGIDIWIKTVYCLPQEMQVVWESFLKKNDFTDYYQLEPETDQHKEIWGAAAKLHFFIDHKIEE